MASRNGPGAIFKGRGKATPGQEPENVATARKTRPAGEIAEGRRPRSSGRRSSVTAWAGSAAPTSAAGFSVFKWKGGQGSESRLARPAARNGRGHGPGWRGRSPALDALGAPQAYRQGGGTRA